MPRSLLRLLTTAATSLLLLALTAFPALAAAGTKPTAEDGPYVVGSLEQLITTTIVGILIGVIAYTMLPRKDAAAEDDHH